MSRTTLFNKSFGTDFNSTLKLSKDRSLPNEIDRSSPHQKSYSEALSSKDNVGGNEYTKLVENSMYVEENAQTMAQENEEEDALDRDIMSAVSEFNSKKGFLMFNPNKTWKVMWDIIGFVIIIYQSIVIPYRICFDVPAEDSWYYIEWIMDIIFWIDILITFNTGIYIKGMLVMQRHRVVWTYLTGWFVMDVLASFPYSLVIESFMNNDPNSNLSSLSSTPRLLRLLKIVRFLRILRLLRVLKLKRFLYKLEEYIVTDTLTLIMDSLKILLVIFFMTHLMACTFYFCGDYEASTEPLTWISAQDIQDSDNYEKYITSVYYAFTTITTVGYGDISPVTNLEKVYAIFGMLIACGFFAFIVGSIGSIVNKSNIMVSEFRLKILHINQFLIHKNVPTDLRTTIMSYLEYLCDYKKMYKLEEGEVLAMLNDTLRDEVIVYLNGRILQNSLVFKHFSMLFLSEITFKLTHHTYAIDDNVFEEGNMGDKLYFINKGSVIIVHKKSKTFIKEIGLDTCFGEVSFFSDLPRSCTVSSKTFTETMIISRRSFEEIMQIYPTNLAMFEEINRIINEKGDLNPIGVSCYICDKVGHMAMDCKEYWRIEGNVKRHLRRLKSINTHPLVTGENQELAKEVTHRFLKKKLTSKIIRKQEAEDEEIRKMFKEKLESNQPVDVLGIAHNNAEIQEDEDEIGIYDHIYDSSSEDEKKKRKSKREDKLFHSHLSEVKEEESEMDKLSKMNTVKKFAKKITTKQGTSQSSKKDIRSYPNINVENMGTSKIADVTSKQDSLTKKALVKRFDTDTLEEEMKKEMGK